MEQNPSMDEQIKKQERERTNADDKALQELLDELDVSPRKLSSAEVAFLQRQLDRFDGELSKPHEESIRYDDMSIKTDKINKILENAK